MWLCKNVDAFINNVIRRIAQYTHPILYNNHDRYVQQIAVQTINNVPSYCVDMYIIMYNYMIYCWHALLRCMHAFKISTRVQGHQQCFKTKYINHYLQLKTYYYNHTIIMLSIKCVVFESDRSRIYTDV